jgi:phosphatidylglycerophosphate synthase
MGDYEDQLEKENENLNKEIDKLQNDFNRYGRLNEYYGQDEVMLVFVQKIMTILYAVIYFGFLYFLAISERHVALKIFLLAVFATLPFVVHLITAYLYSYYKEVANALGRT